MLMAKNRGENLYCFVASVNRKTLPEPTVFQMLGPNVGLVIFPNRKESPVFRDKLEPGNGIHEVKDGDPLLS